MQAYPEYQAVGGRWFDRLPSSWDVLRAKWIFSNEKERSSEDDEQLAASQKYGVVPQKLMIKLNNANVMLALKGTENFKKVKKNDFVISLRSFEGGIEYSGYKGCISPAYTVLRLRDKWVEPKYFKYALKCNPFVQALNATSEGIRDGKTITYDEFGELLLALPPENAQQAIANFLDRETARIDNLIAEKQNFINLLKEKQQALIGHVVTKGLDPNVKMKDSGVEWIGNVPEHWEITKLRYLGKCQNGINIGGEFFGSGKPFVSYGDVYKNRILPTFVKGLVQSSGKDEFIYSVKKGDVFFTRTSETIEEIGFTSVCKKTIESAVFAGFLIRFRPIKKSLDINYSGYYLQNEKLRAFFVKEMNLVTRASLSQGLLKRMPVVLPPIVEQQDIAEYLLTKTEKINSLIKNVDESIILLKEHRTALIGAAVTGKIDVTKQV